MNGIDFSALIIVGVLTSAFMQFIKSNIASTSGKILTVAAISVVLGTVYFFIRDTAYLQTVITILTTAGAVYTYFFQQLERNEQGGNQD